MRLAARADSRRRAQSLVAALEAQVRDRLGGLIFGADDDTLEGVIAGLLAGRHMSVTAVELGTGGSISRRLSENRLGSDLFRDGLVLPDVAALRRVLAVEVEPADPVGLVVRAAQRARLLYDASLGLAAMVHESGPGSEPGVALFAALAWADGSHHLERRYGGHFGLAPQWMASLALGMLWKHLRAG